MMNPNDVNFSLLSEECLLVSWPSKIRIDIINQVNALEEYLATEDGVKELVPAYASLAIYFNYTQFDSESIKRLVLNSLAKIEIKETEGAIWDIPVCYESVFGLDLPRFEDELDISAEELIELHTISPFTVLMRGFQPGFLYMGELDLNMHLPRLSKPRSRVPEGSIGIADGQTGIYPLESPGGWNIIGRTPVKMLDFSSADIVSIQQGDKVLFRPIEMKEYELIKRHQSGPSKI